MKNKLLFLILFSLLPALLPAQAAPDLGILWQKENIGLDVKFAKFSKDGQFVYLATDTSILKMSAETGEILSTFDNKGLPKIEFMFSLAISSSGNYLVASNGYGICIWDTRTESPYKSIVFRETGKDTSALNAVFTNDEKNLIIKLKVKDGSDNPPYYIMVYDLESDKPDTSWYVPGFISQIAISHDGKHFATGTTYQGEGYKKYYDKLILWETGTWKEAAVLEDIEGTNDGYRHIKFSPNDKYIGSVRNEPNVAHIFDLTTKKLLKVSFPYSDPYKGCYQFEILPDNLHLLFSFYDDSNGERTIELHDFNKLIKVYPIMGSIIESFDSNGTWKIYCSTWHSITLMKNLPTSVIDKDTENPFKVFFENGMVILEANTALILPIEVTIYDLIGNTLYNESITDISANGKHIMNINLPSGLYIGKIVSGGKEFSVKFEVAR